MKAMMMKIVSSRLLDLFPKKKANNHVVSIAAGCRAHTGYVVVQTHQRCRQRAHDSAQLIESS
jgi:hypothetical protein